MNRPQRGFNGHITDLRFVQLVDGRKILQFADAVGDWWTPPTIQEKDLDPVSKAELLGNLGNG